MSKTEHEQQALKLEAIGRLAAGIVHDFNNILGAVDAGIHLLKKQLDADPASPKVKDILEEILRRTENGGSLTRQLLAFSREQPLSPARLDLNERVNSLGRMLATIVGPGVTVDLELHPDVGSIVIDANHLDLAILNLAANARDAMAGNGRLLVKTLEFSESLEEGAQPPQACVVISDTGCGMRPEVLSQVFEPFFTTKEVGRGTGLGLSQVYGFVQQSGGQISIESEVGAGTSIRLLFPKIDGVAAI